MYAYPYLPQKDETPYEVAVRMNHDKAVEVLLRSGAKVSHHVCDYIAMYDGLYVLIIVIT